MKSPTEKPALGGVKAERPGSSWAPRFKRVNSAACPSFEMELQQVGGVGSLAQAGGPLSNPVSAAAVMPIVTTLVTTLTEAPLSSSSGWPTSNADYSKTRKGAARSRSLPASKSMRPALFKFDPEAEFSYVAVT